jgi:hypothetical protein
MPKTLIVESTRYWSTILIQKRFIARQRSPNVCRNRDGISEIGRQAIRVVFTAGYDQENPLAAELGAIRN